MAQSINLIPRQEQQVQFRARIVKASSVMAIFLLLLVAGIAGLMVYQTDQLKEAIAVEDGKIEAARNDIQALKDIEVTARTLDAKYQILAQIFESSRDYSKLMDELDRRTPEAVVVETLSITGAEKSDVNIQGRGTDYISIARFTRTLADPEFDGGVEGLNELFQNVSLNSVSLDSNSLEISYLIVGQIDPEIIK